MDFSLTLTLSGSSTFPVAPSRLLWDLPLQAPGRSTQLVSKAAVRLGAASLSYNLLYGEASSLNDSASCRLRSGG